jgi:DNA-binding beta-propeller fold protein YncE
MFTDIVRSTELASELGDRAWKDLVSRHNSIVRRELQRHRGRELDTAGDGFFAIFDGPWQAIDCASSIIAALAPLSVQIRTAIHTGETEVIGSKVGGITVNVAARVLGRADPGQILVTSTVREIAAGSGVEFVDRGEHQLKGVPGTWHLYAVAAKPEAQPPRAPTAADEQAVRPRWRRALPFILLAAVGLAAGTAGGALLVLQGSQAPPVPAANTVAALHHGTHAVASVTQVGRDPADVVEGFDSMWVANFADRTVQQLDAATGESIAVFALSASGNPTGLAVGGDFVWVASGIDGVIARIDPRTGGIREIEVGVGLAGIAYAEGSVWATNGQTNEVLRIDPQTEHVERIALEGDSQPTGIAVDAESVWVAEHLAGRVTRIDPVSMRIEATVELLGGRPDRVAIGLGFIWVTVGSDDSVARIHPDSGRPTTIPEVGDGPYGIAVDDEVAWVANALDGTVVRLDPQQAAVIGTIDLGFSPQGVAVAANRIWVTLAE